MPAVESLRGEAAVHVLLGIRTLSGAGAELVVETLARGLDPAAFSVTVCEGVGAGEKGRALRERGYDVVSLVPNGNPRSSYLNPLRLWRIVTSRRIDIVHTHCAASLSDAALCRLLRPRLRIVHTFHYGNYPHVVPAVGRLERAFNRFAAAKVAVGYRQADSVSKTYGLEPGAVTTIWNGVRRRPARPDSDLVERLRARGGIVVGSVGTLIEQKGYFELLEAAAELKRRGVGARFVVAGGGRLRADLEARVRHLGIADTVEFLGWVPDAAETVLPVIDVFFQPSRWEAMSMVLLEAAAQGLPILCTDVGDASRILEAGTEALVVPAMDVGAMAAGLQRLVEDPGLRRRLGAAARMKVEASCSAESMIRQYQDLYLKVLGRTPAA